MISSKSSSTFRFVDRISKAEPWEDRLLRMILWPAGVLAGTVSLAIVLVITIEAGPGLGEIGVVRLLADPSWHPANGRFNLLPIIVDTVLVAALATSLAAAAGILSAIFCTSFAPRMLATCFTRMIELLAGIPSVVFGLWGMTVLVPAVAALAPPGPSLLAATLVLTLMILPTVTLVATSSLSRVPASLLIGGKALGLSAWSIATKIALPAARRGIATGVVLALGRALGETMAVLMVSGNIVQIPGSLFDPIRTLPATIALEIPYAEGLHRASLFVCALVLMAIVLTTVCFIELFQPESARD
jgi:phosphate transport system permease protein